MAANQPPLPPGATRIFAVREHNGQPRNRYVGYRVPGDSRVWMWSHQDKDHHPCERADLVGEDLIEPDTLLGAAMDADDAQSRREFLKWLRANTPSLFTIFLSGRMGPDQSESADERRDRGPGSPPAA
ncbi:MAG: hypothetical protein ACK47B_10840 [Armatimonadota bacterium]